MPKLAYKNTAALMRPHAHDRHPKSLIVLHETVSSDIPGWKDIDNVEAFLAAKDYGIHGMTDAEGNVAWANGLGNAVFWQAGGVNYESIGIEQVSNIMLRSPSNAVRRKLWVAREKQLRATAKLIAAISNTRDIPIRAATYDHAHRGFTSGVLSHYQVSQFYSASEGHTDCWPVNLGGYYPLYEVLQLAKGYKALGFTL